VSASWGWSINVSRGVNRERGGLGGAIGTGAGIGAGV
jgi:hypothetical protein